MTEKYLVNTADMVGIADAIREKCETTEQLTFPSDFVTGIQNIKTGVDLNFEIVGGNEKPSDPIENTIWIKTETEIAGWMFTSEEPTEPAEGMIWILIDQVSNVDFNTMKENGIQVHPLNAKQYVDGAWVGRPALIYQDGEWHDWLLTILDGNGFYTKYTGPFAIKYQGGASGSSSVSVGSTYITMYNAANNTDVAQRHCVCSHSTPIDLTGYTTLTVNVSGSSGSQLQNTYLCAGVGLAPNDTSMITRIVISDTNSGTFHIDLSDVSGLCYIKFYLACNYSGTVTRYIYQIALE